MPKRRPITHGQSNNSAARMTPHERGALAKLICLRERVLKSKTKERSAELVAQFEQQIAAVYSFDDDEVWREAHEAAEAAIKHANEQVARRCRELGIPKQFAPSLDCQWWERGENAVKKRREELRKVALSHIAALQREAITKIETMALEAHTEVISQGIETKAARTFIDRMPPLDALMPQLNIREIQKLLPGRRQWEDD
jgi:hypothetical protein